MYYKDNFKKNENLNSLPLDYSEKIIYSIDSYLCLPKKYIYGKLHLTKHFILFKPFELEENIIKIYYTKNFLFLPLNLNDSQTSFREIKFSDFNHHTSEIKKIGQALNNRKNSAFTYKNSLNFTENNKKSKKKGANTFLKFKSYKSDSKYQKKKNYFKNRFFKFLTDYTTELIKNNNTDNKFNLDAYFQISSDNILEKINNNNLLSVISNAKLNNEQLISFLQTINQNYRNSINIEYYQIFIIRSEKITKINPFFLSEVEFNSNNILEGKIINDDSLNNLFNSLTFILSDNNEKIKRFYTFTSNFLNKYINESEKLDEREEEIIRDDLIKEEEERLQKYFEKSNNDKINSLYSSLKISKIKNIKTIKLQTKCTLIKQDTFQKGIFTIFEIMMKEEEENEMYVEFSPVNINTLSKNIYFSLNEVKTFLSYRLRFKSTAINIIFYTEKESNIFDFDDHEKFLLVFNYFCTYCNKVHLNTWNLKYTTNLWVDGLISNFDYLLYINLLSGRSLNDLSQYPIFPWTYVNFTEREIDTKRKSNYRDLSKNIGMLNNYNKEKENLEDIGYNSNNYSSSNIVSYYLLRSHPDLLNILYKVSSNKPIKIFCSIMDDWISLTEKDHDYMNELIPEFYDTSLRGSFLKNFYNLSIIQEEIKDVELPKWTKSPKTFIEINRRLLETENVSDYLNLWIDSVFGYKIIGNESSKNNHVYTKYAYDLYNTKRKEDEGNQTLFKKEENAEIREISIQIFDSPHPKKRTKIIKSKYRKDTSIKNKSSDLKKLKKIQKERLKIETKYDKQRRDMDLLRENILNEFYAKDNTLKEVIQNLNYSKQYKELQFKRYAQKLLEVNNENKSNFDNYQKYKENYFYDGMNKIENTYLKKINGMFSENTNLSSLLKKLESVTKYSEERIKNLLEKNINLDNLLIEKENQNKKLKIQINCSETVLRKFPLGVKNLICI